MRCAEAERLMNAILDGDLANSPRLDAHLDACSGCRELYSALRQTVADLTSASWPEPATDIVAGVMGRLPRPDIPSTTQRVAQVLLGSVLTAAAVAVGLVGWRLGLPGAVASSIVGCAQELAAGFGGSLDAAGSTPGGRILLTWALSGVLSAALVVVGSVARLLARPVLAEKEAQ